MAIKRTQYRDPLIEKIIDHLKQGANKDIKNWYHGDVLLIQKRELPAVSVAIDNTIVTTDSTGDDKSTVPIVISVRERVSLIERSITSPGGICLYLRKFSRIRSNTTTVSFIE